MPCQPCLLRPRTQGHSLLLISHMLQGSIFRHTTAFIMDPVRSLARLPTFRFFIGPFSFSLLKYVAVFLFLANTRSWSLSGCASTPCLCICNATCCNVGSCSSRRTLIGGRRRSDGRSYVRSPNSWLVLQHQTTPTSSFQASTSIHVMPGCALLNAVLSAVIYTPNRVWNTSGCEPR